MARAQGGQEQPDSLFDAAEQGPRWPRLAVRMRPRALSEVIGQRRGRRRHPAAQARRPRRADVLAAGRPAEPAKTTLAHVVSLGTKREFIELSAVMAGVKDVRAAIGAARRRLDLTGRQTLLFIDEVLEFNKAQQDALLPRWRTGVHRGHHGEPVLLGGRAMLSRSLLLTLQPLTEDDMVAVIDRALASGRGWPSAVTLRPARRGHLVRLAGGDARQAMEAAALGLEAGGGEAGEPGEIDVATLERAVDRAAVRYDRDGDQHYDVISAFIKSIRGSDADAALHYLARMIEAGEDPRFIARRLIVHASEDIGLADPSALQAAVAAAQAVEFVGLPEARINLAQATIHLALAPKSNAVIKAIGAAEADVKADLARRCPHTCGMRTTRAHSGQGRLPVSARPRGRHRRPGLRVEPARRGPPLLPAQPARHRSPLRRPRSSGSSRPGQAGRGPSATAT